MPRKLVGGLIQAAAPLTDPSMPIDRIRKAAIDAHIPLIEEAGRDAYWYDIAEAVPGPTTVVVAEMDFDMIEEVRRAWQFYRDRRPETYGSGAEQLP
jgi:predicted amidohydrolase